ncbi:MAG: M20/M25/M40 family metallo-hydrolase [Gracilimonas sp.]|uniref:M20/M25/M40 family metallo-hydrolase n=1 Tax=Gracilimonas sp. TaxID=1974203 RepID=UPI0019864DFB|nr:M20/M25/M40 family metallo-hydrolase [Gracilimonas sp.]MBD3617244.1 M20/M25/M40 family metallo-hydrolase [Gracilimonas sp.]
MKKFLSLTLLLLFSCNLFAQQLSDTEKNILERIDANHADALQFLETNVNINSGTLNFEGVKKVGENYIKAFNELGFETRWIPQDEVNRAGHFFAEQKGNSGKKLLLIGHLDTVFEPDSPFQEFEMLNDSVATGPGVNDMKAGNVMIFYALKALKEANAIPDAQIIVAFTGDEEKAGSPTSISRKDLVDAARRSDVALGFETASGFSYATVARRASFSWKLEVEGRQAHSSGIFSDYTGAGSVYETSRILNRFYEELREENLTYNVGVILGGNEVDYDEENIRGSVSGKTNIVPKKTLAHGGIRFLTTEQGDRAFAKMREIVSDHLPRTSAELTIYEGYPPMEPTDGNMELLSVLSELSQDLGLGEVEAYDPGRRGAADISFVANYVDGLDGLGAMGSGAHGPNETINLKTYKELTKRAALLIYRLTQSE